MITKQQRTKISALIEAKQTALSELNQADFASEIKAHAAFAYVRASDRLEAYLDSLVASENTTASNDGWIEWKGGACPVCHGVLVDVKYRDGQIYEKLKALCFDERRRDASVRFWHNDGADNDIVAYRIVSE